VATLADGGRITERLVENEIERLKANRIEAHNDLLSDLLTAEQLAQMDTSIAYNFNPSSKSAAAEFSVGRSSPSGRAVRLLGSVAEVIAEVWADWEAVASRERQLQSAVRI